VDELFDLMQSVHSKNSTPDDKDTSHIVQEENLQYIAGYTT